MESTTNTLEAFATLIGQRQDPDFIDTYLSALDLYEPSITFMFSTAEEYAQMIREGRARPADQAYIARMQAGETVVSDITYAEHTGGHCYVIGVPVFVGGRFVAGLRAVMDAEMLISTDRYASPYGVPTASFLMDGRGNVLLSRGAGARELPPVR